MSAPPPSPPALPTHRRRWPVGLRALLAGALLAGALSTLAGGAAERARPAGRLSAAATATATATTERAEVGSVAVASAGAATTAHTAAARLARQANPPPYAPGGDDLLPTGDLPAAALPVAAIGPAATPLLWLERERVALGDSVVLHLANADAGRCQGAGALSGLALTGPRIALRASAAGQHRLALRCGGGTAAAVEVAVTLTVPLPVAASSGENRQAQDAQTARLPDLRQLGLRPLGPSDPHGPELLALGDFLQQGRQALFTVAAGIDGEPIAHVLARDAAGQWVDRSADLLAPDQRSVCPGAAQLISVDFNRDGRPDVWVACNGGRQLLFLSQADGRYHRIETPFLLKALQAEARDVDGDGWADIVTLDVSAGGPRTLLLLGRGDGRFVAGPAAAWGLAPGLGLASAQVVVHRLPGHALQEARGGLVDAGGVGQAHR